MQGNKEGISPYRAITFVVIALLAVNAVLGFALAHQAEITLTEQIRARMLDIARSAAALLDGDYLESLTEQDQNEPAYQQTLDTLSAFRSNSDIRFIYCVRRTADGSFEFTADPDTEFPAAFGEAVAYTDALVEASEGEPSVDLVAYRDRWGRFYSAYCPVFNSANDVAGIVCVDLPAEWYEDRIDILRRLGIINAIASFFMAVVAVLVIRRLTIMEQKHQEKLLYANRYNSLTGLANKDYFFELADGIHDEIAESGEEPAILYIDLVGLKIFNHRNGFAEGDKLLKAFADFIADRFGRDNCGYFGEDHFAVITNSSRLDERLDELMADCVSINNANSVPLRIGIYLHSHDEPGISACCDRARLASLQALDSYHSTRIYFSHSMFAQTERRQHIIDNIDRAIDEGWIKVHYQAIVRTSNGQVCDEEALARWDDPELGMLSPADFIPALEDSYLAYKLDLHVLDQVLSKMAIIADAGLFVVPSSINLSRSDFDSCDIVEEVRSRVDAAGISHDKVRIEITETTVGRNPEYIRMQIERFHNLGFQVWMDDFGSEYSSLDNLQSLGFDLLKLDMRFMQQLGNGEKNKIILTELAKMAFGLGVETIAEGVETLEQVEFLREIGVSKLQGYYFTKPVPLDEILKRSEEGTAIGFENPAESSYYAAIGSVNLYDLSSITHSDDAGLKHYFDVLPMAVVELDDSGFTVLRCTNSYRDLIQQSNENFRVGDRTLFSYISQFDGSLFANTMRSCAHRDDWVGINSPMADGTTAHTFMRRIAANPVTGSTAIAIAILSVYEG